MRLHHPFMGEIQFCFKTIFMNGSLIYMSIIGSDLLHIYFEVHNFLCNTKIKGEILYAFISFTTKQLRDECSLPAWHRLCSSHAAVAWRHQMETFSITSPLCGEFTGHRWIPLTKARDAELWYFLWSARINGWVNNREVGDLRRHSAHAKFIWIYSDVCIYTFVSLVQYILQKVSQTCAFTWYLFSAS